MSRAMRSTNPVSPLLASYLPLPSCDGSLNYSAVVIAVLIKFIVHRHFQVSDMKWGELMEQTWKTGNRKWHGPEMQVIRADVEIKWHGPEMQVIRADMERIMA